MITRRAILLVRSSFWFVAVLFLASTLTTAQTGRFLFAGIPWGSSAESVKKVMSENKFTLTQTSERGDLLFKGTLLGHDASIAAFFGKSKSLVKISATLITPDNKAIPTYRDTKETLIKLYGLVSSSFENFSSPYYAGDGYEEQAIRVGKATFLTMWEGDKETGSDYPENLSISITEKLTVNISYEASAWGPEVDSRKAEQSSILKKKHPFQRELK